MENKMKLFGQLCMAIIVIVSIGYILYDNYTKQKEYIIDNVKVKIIEESIDSVYYRVNKEGYIFSDHVDTFRVHFKEL